MRFHMLTSLALIAGLTPFLSGCNDAISDASGEEEENTDPLMGDDDSAVPGVFVSGQPLGEEDVVMMERPSGDVMLASRSGLSSQGGYVVEGALEDGAIDGFGFGSASGDVALPVTEIEDGYELTTPHGTRTVTEHNYTEVPDRIPELEGDWEMAGSNLTLTINDPMDGLVTSRLGEVTLGSEGDPCYFTGSINNAAPGTEPMMNLWWVTVSKEDEATTCTLNGHEVQGNQTGLATVAAPNGVDATERELIWVTSYATLATQPTRLFARFTPAAP